MASLDLGTVSYKLMLYKDKIWDNGINQVKIYKGCRKCSNITWGKFINGIPFEGFGKHMSNINLIEIWKIEGDVFYYEKLIK